MNTSRDSVDIGDQVDPFSLSPKERKKLVQEYVKKCPFLGEYLSESELVTLIQRALHTNMGIRRVMQSMSLSDVQSKETFFREIIEFPISIRTKTVLDRSGYLYIGDLASKKKNQLEKVYGIGVKGLEEIEKLFDTLEIGFGLNQKLWKKIRPTHAPIVDSDSQDISQVQNSKRQSILDLLNGGE